MELECSNLDWVMWVATFSQVGDDSGDSDDEGRRRRGREQEEEGGGDDNGEKRGCWWEVGVNGFLIEVAKILISNCTSILTSLRVIW